MKTNEYKKVVRDLLAPVKVAKAGLRANMKKSAMVNINHAMSGVVSSIADFQLEMEPYLLGFQLTDAIRDSARPFFGDILYYHAAGAKFLKVKLPTSTKKVVSKDTITKQILELTHMVVLLTNAQTGQFNGQEIPQDSVKAVWEELTTLLWGLSYSVFGATPDVIMDENIAKLRKQYPQGKWEPSGIPKVAEAQQKAA